MNHLREQFPALQNDPTLVYLDSGASALKPQSVIDAVHTFYTKNGAPTHRGLYPLSEQATVDCEQVREKAATFLGCSKREIVFTSGTTHGLNIAAQMLEPELEEGGSIILSELEHHANILPWQRVCERTGAQLVFLETDQHGDIKNEQIDSRITNQTKVVSVSGASNVLGTMPDIKRICTKAKEVGAISIIDAAQLAPHKKIDVKDIGCDMLALSGHKIYGPTGIGILYISENLLDKTNPSLLGGGIISMVTKEDYTLVDGPHKFEPGVPNTAGIIGLGAAIDFLMMNRDVLEQQEMDLTEYALTEFEKNSDILTLYGSKNAEGRTAVFSFALHGAHPHDVADLLGKKNIATRAGAHCAMPLLQALDIPSGTVRASLGAYTTKEDIDKLLEALREIHQIFN